MGVSLLADLLFALCYAAPSDLDKSSGRELCWEVCSSVVCAILAGGTVNGEVARFCLRSVGVEMPAQQDERPTFFHHIFLVRSSQTPNRNPARILRGCIIKHGPVSRDGTLRRRKVVLGAL